MSLEDPEDPVSAESSARTRLDLRPQFASTMVTPVSSPQVDAGGPALDDRGFEARYDARGLLGRGGMGEVHSVRDDRIGRDVAMKVIAKGYGSRSDALARFVREARVQGQLEHPAIVPVYDLGARPDGAAFFTMKRVRGETLEQIIEGLRRKDESTIQKHSRRKLLTAFSNVCLAIDFAHTRGVFHRDLKPGNVMLGDYGEVYVLDWGLAKIAGTSDPGPATTDPRAAFDRIEEAGTGSPANTAEGAIMGTPGYMAPEQIRGRVDARSEVYALGAILFELLALDSLHPRSSPQGILGSTLAGTDARPSARAPDAEIAPELDDICVRATALDPEARFASARELYEAIEGYLDGDRDVARRREIARAHADAATKAVELALRGDPSAAEARKSAMRDLGRALALDPDNRDALTTLVTLMTTPPASMPPEVEKEIEQKTNVELQVAARLGHTSYLVLLVFVPLLVWMGIRDWTSTGSLLVSMAALAALGVAYKLRMKDRDRDDKVLHTLVYVAGAAVMAVLSRSVGPFVLVPAMAAVHTIAYLMTPFRVPRWFMVAVGVLPVVVPAVLERFGVLAPTYRFEGDTIVVLAQMHHFPPTATYVFLLIASIAVIVTPSMYVRWMRDALDEAERRLVFYSWQLRQLIPALPPASATPPPPSAEAVASGCPI